MSSSLQLVSERFPHLRERLAHIFARDAVFQKLCDDYEACCSALERLQPLEPGPEAMRSEYAALRLRLETELLQHLEKALGQPVSGKEE